MKKICGDKIEYGSNAQFVRYCELKPGHRERDGTKCATRVPVMSAQYFTAEELNKQYAIQQPTAPIPTPAPGQPTKP